MNANWIFHGCDEASRARLQAHWEKKWQRLDKLLTPYRPDLEEVELTVHQSQRLPQELWYDVRAVIHLPTGALVAEASDRDLLGVLDQVTDRLAAEIRRHREGVRRDFVLKRKARQRADLSAVVPLLERDRQTGRREDFIRLLRPLLRPLRDLARRELKIRELEGTLHRGEVTVADLLDEVLVKAWKRFTDRPIHLPFDLWLLDLLYETLEQWVTEEPRPRASLREQVGEPLPDEAPQVGEQEWWTWLLGYEEKFRLEDLIPGAGGTDAWDQLEAEEQRDRLLSLINTLPEEQRQAFLLHALEEYDAAEIALLQDRSESEVRADIEAARQALGHRLRAGGPEEGAGEAALEQLRRSDHA